VSREWARRGGSALAAELESGAVPTTLADPPTAPAAEQASAAGQPAPQPEPGAASAATPQRACANCGAPMDGAQDWCLQCGRGAPGSLRKHAAGWRSGATVLAAAAILAVGAAAAAYAALSKEGAKPRVVRTTVAQSAPPAASVPGGVVPGAPTPPSSLGTPTTVKPVLPGAALKPPRIPLATVTPKATSTPPTAASGTGTTNSSTTSPAASGGSSASGETLPAAILLDTNAAATYNPYGYPVSDFGDPSLAIDGETATAWTAQLEPAVAPKMAEGLVIDLKSPHRLSALVLATSTPGMTIQIYGANGHTLPGSITDHAWVKLSPNIMDKSKHLRLKLREAKKAFRFVTLWISKAPASSVGTAQAPGHVSVNELELFPAS
jgi:hypothetical protein